MDKEGEEGRGRRWEEEDEQPSLLATALSLLLDHFTYLQGVHGNQRKVRDKDLES